MGSRLFRRSYVWAVNIEERYQYPGYEEWELAIGPSRSNSHVEDEVRVSIDSDEPMNARFRFIGGMCADPIRERLFILDNSYIMEQSVHNREMQGSSVRCVDWKADGKVTTLVRDLPDISNEIIYLPSSDRLLVLQFSAVCMIDVKTGEWYPILGDMKENRRTGLAVDFARQTGYVFMNDRLSSFSLSHLL
jgi:hypothetical protein